jgi:hypothetical protein
MILFNEEIRILPVWEQKRIKQSRVNCRAFHDVSSCIVCF